MKLLFFFVPLWCSVLFAQEGELITFNPEKEYTQEYIDSLIGELKVARQKRIEPQELKKMLESNPELTGWSYYYLGRTVVAFREQKYDSAIYYGNQGIAKFYETKEQRDFYKQNVMLIYNAMADAHTEAKRHKEAIQCYQKALEITKENPYAFSAFFVAGIASSHYKMGNDSLAFNYYLETVKDSAFMSFPRAAGSTYIRLGVLQANWGNDDEAKLYFNKALKIGDSTDYKGDVTPANTKLGNMALRDSNLDLALDYYKKAAVAIDSFGSSQYDGSIEQERFVKASIKVLEGPVNQGIEELEDLVEILKNEEVKAKHDYDQIMRAFDVLGIAYQKQGDYSKYQTLLQDSFEYFNAFQEDQLQENIQRLETEYQTKEKDASIAQLEQNREQQKTIINQQRTIGFILGGSLLFILGLGGLLWRQRKIRTLYEKENLEQRLLRTQMNPHFIGNALNTVGALVEKGSENTQPYIRKLSELFRLILTNSREEFVSLEDEVVTLKSYLELQSNFSKNFDYSFNIEDDLHEDEVIVPPMLIQPFIENSILHGLSHTEERGRIQVNISKEGKGLLRCDIVDNGIGYSESLKIKRDVNHKSVSQNIIKERLEILKKQFKVNSRFLINDSTKGTHISLYLPYLLDE
ncbi:histidine kinase [Aureisphaera galaxeae]|uniref:histidine kinase n=1 Tax=Aureisphaera galaxeae TaxID=1538023 RepID=UPI0023501C19|nr:histidine kinase [Aureisphaera galaxeae]MDC8002565.1 histidine kinase [Aureisphaera galaxeae]